jgi:hypothetical protein
VGGTTPVRAVALGVPGLQRRDPGTGTMRDGRR